MSLKAKAKKIKLLVLDVDGVLTDGRIIYSSSGEDFKLFDVQDGLGIYMLSLLGVKTVIVSARDSKTIYARAKDMRVEAIYTDVRPKTKVLEIVKRKFKVREDELCFVGDDLIDYSIMKRCGFSVAVRNAVSEIKKIADYVTIKEGGRGAVREVAELLLRSKGKWKQALNLYK